MRALLALASLAGAAAAAVAAVDAHATAPAAAPARTAICAPASLAYRGAPYRVVHLRRHRLDLGLRLRRPLVRATALLTDHAGCTDVIVCTLGEPCAPPPAAPPSVTDVPVLRLARISPAAALASDNPGVIYVAGNVCVNARVGRPLVRCLRRA